jgi:hypothetical protein
VLQDNLYIYIYIYVYTTLKFQALGGGSKIAAGTAVLRSIPKEAFADSFQKLYESCLPCVVKDGDYFESQ